MKQSARALSVKAVETPRRQGRGKDAFLQSFAKGLSVISAFGRDTRTMTLSQVAAKAGLSRAGARRILLTLQALSYVGTDGRDFYLTPKILDLGYSYLSSTPLWDLAEPFMEEVVNEVHESCSASVLNDTEILYILRVPTKKIMTINLSIGSRLPAWCTSMGRVLLGGLSEDELDAVLHRSQIKAYTTRTVTDRARIEQIIRDDRRKGWSLVNQELEDGLVSISVPLIDRSGPHGRSDERQLPGIADFSHRGRQEFPAGAEAGCRPDQYGAAVPAGLNPGPRRPPRGFSIRAWLPGIISAAASSRVRTARIHRYL